MKSIKNLFLTVTFLSLSTLLYGNTTDDEMKSQFIEFYYAYQSKDTDIIRRYITESSQFGFGGEYGIQGFLDVYFNNEHCYWELMKALQQGCKISKQESDIGCFSPLQLLDLSVIYPSARAKFSFTNKKLLIDFAICGAD